MEEKILYWAFQSSQLSEPSGKELEAFQRKYKKDFNTRELYTGDELLQQYRLHGWRNPMYSFINSIVLAFEHNGTLRIKHIQGEEKDLLQTFNNLLRNEFQEYQLIHFDSEIVLPYIGVRLNKNGWANPVHKDLKYFGMKSWNLTGMDLKAYYQGAGKYSFSLKDMAFIFNIDHENIIEFEDEFTFYNSGNLDSLKQSAIQRVEVMAKTYRILRELPSLETILIEEKVESVEEIKPSNFLALLWESQAMTLEVRAGLEKQLKKKKLTKRDREIVREIILGIYISNDFISGQQDTKATIEKKTKEVDKFLETI